MTEEQILMGKTAIARLTARTVLHEHAPVELYDDVYWQAMEWLDENG